MIYELPLYTRDNEAVTVRKTQLLHSYIARDSLIIKCSAIKLSLHYRHQSNQKLNHNVVHERMSFCNNLQNVYFLTFVLCHIICYHCYTLKLSAKSSYKHMYRA